MTPWPPSKETRDKNHHPDIDGVFTQPNFVNKIYDEKNASLYQLIYISQYKRPYK